MFCKLWEHVEAPPSKRRRNEEAWSATSSCIWLDETTVPWSLLKAAISHYCPGTDKRRILGDSYRKFRGPPGTKTIFLLHIAIEGVLTRQKCAETPYATFWAVLLNIRNIYFSGFCDFWENHFITKYLQNGPRTSKLVITRISPKAGGFRSGGLR